MTTHTREQAARIIGHHLRAELLGWYAREDDEFASGRSPSDLAVELGHPIGNVSYHTRILARLGAVVLMRTKQVRGAVEHYYAATEWGTEVLAMFTRRTELTINQAVALLVVLNGGRVSKSNGDHYAAGVTVLEAIADGA